MTNSVTNFIPEIWSLKIQKIFDKTCVWMELVNKDYEGEIKACGDTVHVRTFGDITINNYTRNQTLAFQDLVDPMSDLVIDQQKYFAFLVDDLDKAQADIGILEGYSKRAAQAIREVIDQHCHSHYVDIPAQNVVNGASSNNPITLSKDNIYSYITLLGEKLTNSSCPEEGRNLVISAKFRTMLQNAPEFTRATGQGDQVVTNGKIGTVSNFTVYISTNLNIVNSNTPLVACTKDFISFGSQVSKVEPVAPYDKFGKGVKGLYLYGSKVFSNSASGKGPDKTGAVLWAEGA
jgi:hypothetical protein